MAITDKRVGVSQLLGQAPGCPKSTPMNRANVEKRQNWSGRKETALILVLVFGRMILMQNGVVHNAHKIFFHLTT